MKNPNGYGSIYKQSDRRRRKPWRVVVTTGWTTNAVTGKAVQTKKTIGCFESRKEAEIYLAEFNKAPWDIEARTITFAEVYEKWSAESFPKLSKGSVDGYRAGYRVAAPLANMKMIDVNLSAMQSVLDGCGKNTPIQKRYKGLLSQMFDYAVKHDIVPADRNKVQYVEIDKDLNPNALDRQPFSAEEIDKLWSRTDVPYCNVLLMLIYSGVRIDELLDLKKEDVHLGEQWIDVKKSKTDAGVRIVPIADKTLKYFEYWYNLNDCPYLISTSKGGKMLYSNFLRKYWNPIMTEFNMNHKPHDTRHTCVSLLTAAGVDERIIEKIVGHKGSTVTRDVYTHLTRETMLAAINQI
ncbi:MAG: site-specific integrase [Clostridiales bacterium]|nr:site-specific integrase [Clostridiales bacterium]